MQVKDEVVVAADRVKDLKEKVDALVRSLVGSIRREDNKLVKGEQGLEHRLTSDGWDEETKSHKESDLSRKVLLDSFQDVVSKLDEVTGKGHELFGTFDSHFVIPTDITVNPADIPGATNSLLTAQVQNLESSLSAAAAQRPPDQYPPIKDHSQLESYASDVNSFVEPSLALIRESLKSVRGGTGLKKQARRMFDPGWHDLEAERSILAAAVAESALRVLQTCQEHEKVYETLEKMKNTGVIKTATFPVITQLRKELGEPRKALLTKLEAHGKKYQPCDLAPMIASVLLKARLRRMSDATTKGVGLKQEASAAAPGAASTASRPVEPAAHPAQPTPGSAAMLPGAKPVPPGAAGMRPGMVVPPGRTASQPGMQPHGQPHMNMPPGMANQPGQNYPAQMRR